MPDEAKQSGDYVEFQIYSKCHPMNIMCIETILALYPTQKEFGEYLRGRGWTFEGTIFSDSPKGAEELAWEHICNFSDGHYYRK